MAQTFVSQNRRSSLAPSITRSTLVSGTISPLLSTPSLSNGSTATSSHSIASSRSAHPLHYYDIHDLSTTDSVALRLNGQASPTQPFLFPCALRFLPCSFASDDEDEWKIHSLSHFHPFGPPHCTTCPLCPISFPSSSETPSLAWHSRMNHMLLHHRNSLAQATAQADFLTYEYMWKKGLLKDAQLKEIKGNAKFGDRMEEEPVTYTLSASAGRDERHRRKNGRGVRQSIRRF